MMEGAQLNSGAALPDGAVSAAPGERLLDETSEVSPVGTILTPAAPLVSGTRTEADIRHHERQLCATELLILAEREDEQPRAAGLRYAAHLIARRGVRT